MIYSLSLPQNLCESLKAIILKYVALRTPPFRSCRGLGGPSGCEGGPTGIQFLGFLGGPTGYILASMNMGPEITLCGWVVLVMLLLLTSPSLPPPPYLCSLQV